MEVSSLYSATRKQQVFEWLAKWYNTLDVWTNDVPSNIELKWFGSFLIIWIVYSPAREIQAGSIGVNAVQRKFFRFQLLQKVGAKVYEAPATIALTSLTAQIDLQIKVSKVLPL